MEILKMWRPFILITLFVISFNLSAQTDDDDFEEQNPEEIIEKDKRSQLIDDAEAAKATFTEENAALKDLFESTYGYAIFPNVGKGAWILGGAAGNGVVYENGKMVGFAELRQIDVGLQIGGQSFQQVIFFKTEQDLQKFKRGDFQLGGNVSAVAVGKGKAKSVKFKDGIAIATMPKAGAMVEVSVGGQKFDYADDWEN